jgi:hypothetical protein
LRLPFAKVKEGGVDVANQILPAEFFGVADAPDRRLTIGGIEVPVWCERVPVYVRRRSSDLSIAEIEIAAHDGPEQEELDLLNFEAERYPLGPKEHWRSKMVGKYTYGPDHHPMTEGDFEEHWSEDR